MWRAYCLARFNLFARAVRPETISWSLQIQAICSTSKRKSRTPVYRRARARIPNDTSSSLITWGTNKKQFNYICMMYYREENVPGPEELTFPGPNGLNLWRTRPAHRVNPGDGWKRLQIVPVVFVRFINFFLRRPRPYSWLLNRGREELGIFLRPGCKLTGFNNSPGEEDLRGESARVSVTLQRTLAKIASVVLQMSFTRANGRVCIGITHHCR